MNRALERRGWERAVQDMGLTANATSPDPSPRGTLHPVYLVVAAVLLASMLVCLMAVVRRSRLFMGHNGAKFTWHLTFHFLSHKFRPVPTASVALLS